MYHETEDAITINNPISEYFEEELNGIPLYLGGEPIEMKSREESYENSKKILEDCGCSVESIILNIETILQSSCFLQNTDYNKALVMDVVNSIANTIEKVKMRNGKIPEYITINNSSYISVNFSITLRIKNRIN